MSGPPPTLQHLSPRRTLVSSFNKLSIPSATPNSSSINNNNNQGLVDATEVYFDDGDWVLCVNSSSSSIRCALSNGDIQIYDPKSLQVTQTFRSCHGTSIGGNGGIITDLVGAPPLQNADHILVSSGTDGRVCVMDLRQSPAATTNPSVVCAMPQQQQQTSNNNNNYSAEQALSVSLGYDGNLAAVGTNKSKIHFYDLRQPQQPVGSYVNSHTDDVTRVRFQHFCPQHCGPSQSNNNNNNNNGTEATSGSLLLTGSEDGLACIFDTTQPSEEAAIKSVMNTQTSLRQIGFFGPNLEGVYCMTGSETLSLWSWDSAQCLADYSDIRSTLGVDYLVNACWDASSSQLSLLSGSSNGDAMLSTIDITAATNNNGPRPPFVTSHHLGRGHKGVIRDWCPMSASTLITVGEDARICEWDMTAAGQPQSSHGIGFGQTVMQHASSRKTSGGPARRQKNKRGATPY